MKRILFLSIVLLSFSCAENYDRYKDVSASEKAYGIIPKPNNLIKNLGVFALDENVVINSSASLENEANYLVEILSVGEGLSAENILNNSEGQHLIELKISDEVSEEEGYALEVGYDKITIKGKTSTGIFYGIETLRQLITKQMVDGEEMFVVPATKIEDAPRFAYRGMMLDTGRYFYDVAFVKQFIDLIALHKMNIFHWHLTEDQGWRIEIKKYPKLTEVGAWRNGTEIGQTPGTESDNKKHGGFYTQEQIKEVIEYAKKKHITIIPEIDMPGHNGAAIASYPYLSCFPHEKTPMNDNIISEATKKLMANGTKKVVQESWGVKTDVLCAGKEGTYTFFENVLSEVIDLFPSEYIHIGGDECRKDNWMRCPNCQKKIADNDLEGENGLQSHFINHMEKFVNSKGKRIIGWDEILEGGLAPNATVMSWRGLTGGIEAAKQGHPVIISPREPCYFDYYQDKDFASEPLAIGDRGPNTVKDVYIFDPLPIELSSDEQKHIWGVQANLWTEYISTPDYAEYMLLPRMTAISEVAWSSPNTSKDYQEFLQRLDRFKGIYDEKGLNYAKHVFK